MAVPAEMKLAGSGTTLTVEKTPLFCAVQLEKPAPFCGWLILLNESDTAPGVGPPLGVSKGAILGSAEVKVTVTEPAEFELPLEALNPPAAPFAFKEPFVITAVRMLPVALGFCQMLIVPLKPTWNGGVAVLLPVLVNAVKDSNAFIGMVEVPSSVIEMGIKPGVAAGPWVLNVVELGLATTLADTKSVVAVWPKIKMVVALAGVDSASAATQTAANRVSLERMVLLLPL